MRWKNCCWALPTESGGATMNNPEHLRTHSIDFFVNDTWRVRPNFTLTLGLRYEYNSPARGCGQPRQSCTIPATGTLVPVGQNGFPRGGYNPRPQQLRAADRLRLVARSAVEKQCVRAAYGIHYDQSSLAPGEGLYFSAPYYNLNVYYPIQGLFNLSLSNPFPSNFPFPYPASATAFQRDLRTPYYPAVEFRHPAAAWADRAWWRSPTSDRRARDLIDSRDINQPAPSLNPKTLRPNPVFLRRRHHRVSRREFDLSQLAGAASSSASGERPVGAGVVHLCEIDRRRFRILHHHRRSEFSAEQLRPERGTGPLRFRHPPALHAELRLRSADRQGTSLARRLAELRRADVPDRPAVHRRAAAFDNDNRQHRLSKLGFGANNRPNVVGNPPIANPGAAGVVQYRGVRVLHRRGISATPGATFSTGPGWPTVNFSIVKNTAFAERLNVQFRAEFFNLLNRTNFNLPDNFLGSPTFGQIISAQDPRRMQFGLKFLF